ncbi:glutathione peroxidase [bacterium]|nr:MAG: glutathione peroxidase [bacterium]
MNDDHTLYDFKVKSLEGKDVDLADYKGKLVLVVNTASKCGLTPQYKGLEAMYEKYKEKDFVILGFPANDFGNQEPGTATEIVEFCDRNYGVTFPMFEKSTVLGENKSELYKWLVSNSDRPKDEIEWNFAKFLVSREGKVIARFEPKETPEMIDEKIAKAL